MKHCPLFLQVLLLFLFTACETPSDSFERVNINDPASPNFAGGTVTGLSAAADSSGIITLRWLSADNSVDKHIIEKSLGDSLSFSPIAELEPTETIFVDDSRDVRLDTYYRLSSYMEVDGIGDVLYGRTDTKLEFGAISAVEYEYQEDSNQLELTWSTDVPFYTHFIISSDRVISDQQESTVRISAATNKHSFQDPLLDVDFEPRSYSITGVIENEGDDEVVVEQEFEFDAASFFKPTNAQINILNEQDWEITWENKAFFATEVELIRKSTHDGEDIAFPLSISAESYLDNLLLDQRLSSTINIIRGYTIKFLTNEGQSDEVELYGSIPDAYVFFNNSPVSQSDPRSLTLSWIVEGEGEEYIKEFVIEKPHERIPDRFVEIARIDGGGDFQFTDTNVTEFSNPTYRIRSLTSYPSEPVSFIFSHDYDVEYTLNTSMSDITSVEITSDQNYLAATSINRFQSGNLPIYIWDLNSRQLVQTIDAGSEQITDFKLSPDEKEIYYTVPAEGAIYKADFPSGNNKERIIDDAVANLEGVLHLDVSSDGTFLVGTGGRGFIKRWDLDTYDPVFLYSEYTSPTSYLYKNVAISPDGSMIGGNNGSSFIMDADNSSIIESLPGPANMVDLQFSSDGLYYSYVIGFGLVYIFSTENWELIDRTAGRRATFHPENSTLALGSFNNVVIYDPIEKRYLDVVSDRNGRAARSNIQDKITFLDKDRLAIVSGGKRFDIWRKSTNRRWKRFD